MALAYKGVNVTYHPVFINLGEQHLPQYVRINPRCVVPSLVVQGKVTTDSKNILERLDQVFDRDNDNTRLPLIPEDEDERKTCQYWTQKADEMPVRIVTFGQLPGIPKPAVLRIMSKNHEDNLVEELKKLITDYQDDPYLKAAYETKLKVIQQYAKSIHTPADLEEVTKFVDKTMKELEDQLANGPFSTRGGYLCSEKLTTADIEWCVLLKRFDFVGAKTRWVYNTKTLPHVGKYYDKLTALKCYKDGIAQYDSKLQLAFSVVVRKLNAILGKELNL